MPGVSTFLSNERAASFASYVVAGRSPLAHQPPYRKWEQRAVTGGRDRSLHQPAEPGHLMGPSASPGTGSAS